MATLVLVVDRRRRVCRIRLVMGVVNMGDAAEGEGGGKVPVVVIHAHIPPKKE